MVKVTASFSAGASGSDWGAAAQAMVFLEQGGTTTYDGATPLGAGRLPYSLVGTFAVSAGSPVICGLYGAVTGASTATCYDITVVAEFNPT
ncbi:hypothetical protein [Aquabacterium sp. OR-4]|uniref:hypothetical protein n=1 Tax=Aquabacterium sp. OR-4 TaxID=2978127 RepID=UPI0021B2A1BD|nr:hypothetical protein [Aquabacterium sp. OR-4]MDT7836446.1 hypothetical protein [Aquabacterium sp. OR-4]